MVRGDNGGPEPRSGAQRPAHQLDSEGEARAARVPRHDLGGPQASRARQGTLAQQQRAVRACELGAAQHDFVAAVPVIHE